MLIVSGTPTGTSAEHGGNGERLRLANAISKYELFGNFGKNRQTVTLQLTDAMTHNKFSLRAKLRLGRIGRTSRVKNRARRGRLVFESLEHRNLLAGDLLTSIEPDRFDYPLGQDQVLTTMSGGESSWAIAEGESAAEGEDAPDLVAFAKALTDAGVKLFSTAWCSFCSAQKQLFQDGGSYLPYIEVSNPDRTLNEVGIENNITSFPTWEFPDLTRETGLLDLETISQRSGVPIPTSSTPYIKEIENKTLLAGSPLHVVLDGYDPNGDPLTYTIASDNPQVSATLLQGNPGMRIEVAGYGDMTFQLFEQRAPRPVERVVELADSGFYDGIIFHRVIDGFVIQGGDPTGTGSGGSTLGTFDDQYHVDLQHNQGGLLSYAKSSDDTNDSQFFVTLAPTRHLDFNHSIFGILVEGTDALQAIGGTATTTGDRPVYDVQMNTVEIFQDTENAVMMLKADPAAVGQQATITVTVSDGTGNQVQETFQVTVAADPVNGGPFLEDLPDFETTVGTPLQIQLSAIDVEGDPVLYDAQATGSVAADVQVNNETGLVTVTPPAGYVGPLEILVGVQAVDGSDTADPWDTQVVKVNVVGGELELELLPDSDSNIVGDHVTNVTEMTFRISNTSAGALVQLLHDEAVIGQGTATGSSIDITTDNLVALGDGTYALTAVQTLNGVTGDPSNVVTVTLDTTPPVPLTSTPPTTATNGLPLVYDAQHPEEGTPGFRYALVGAPSGAVIDPVTGVVRWTPTINQGGVNTFQIVASDLAGNTQTQNLEIDVTVVAQQVRIELVVTDSQQNPITEISSGEEFLVLAYVQDIRTPAEGVFAAYVDVRYDQSLVTSLATSISDITFGDTYQNGKSGFFTTPGLLDEVGAFANIFSPIGGDKYLLFAAPFRADQEGEMTFTPEPATDMGREVLVFGESTPVAENAITFVSATLTVDSGLSAQPDLFNVDEDSVDFPLDVLDNDTNETGASVTITQVGPTSHGGTVTIADGGQQLLYTPVANFFGEETFWYTITAGGLTSTATVTVQVAPVNDPPTAVDDLDFSVGLNSQDNFLDVLANDLIAPDQGEVLRIISVGSTSHGGTVVIAPNGTHLLYTPASGFSGEETFTYTIRDRVTTDPTGLESTATVRITVESVPRPTAVNDTATVDEDSADNAILVRANDSPAEPGATLTVVAVTQSKFGGTVTIAAGGTHVLYTPAADFFGEDTFTYTIEEQDGGRATASVTVSVLNVNDPPTANDDSYQVSKGSPTRTLNVLENDTILPDIDEVLTIVAVTQGSEGGTVQIAADGKSVLYTPSSDPSLPDTYTETFTYTVDDGSSADNSTDTATVTIQIRPYTERDLGGIVPFASTQYGVGGLMVRLSGTDQFNGSVAMNSQTVANGAYTFSDLAPGSYQIETDSAPFLVLPSTALNVDSADEDGDNLDLDFPSAARDPSTIGIADFLARAPGQSSLSPADSVLVAVHPGNQQHWYSYQAGWQGYTQLEIELDADASLLSVQAVASNGQLYQGTVAMNNAAYIKRLANADDSHLLRIDAGPEQLGLQPVHETPVVTVTPLITNSTTPMITGTVSDGTLQVTVADQTYAEDDGHLAVSGAAWSLQIPETDALDEGTYNVTASATNEAGVVGSDGTTDELIVDTTAPTVTVNSLTTSNPTPAITGTVSDGSLSVTVNDQTYSPGDGNLILVGTNWTLSIPAADTLPLGTYDVSASSTDAAGNVGTDATTGELVIEAEESGGEGEAIDLLWSDDRFLEDVQQTALQDLPTSDDAYAHAVDLILASNRSG